MLTCSSILSCLGCRDGLLRLLFHFGLYLEPVCLVRGFGSSLGISIPYPAGHFPPSLPRHGRCGHAAVDVRTPRASSPRGSVRVYTAGGLLPRDNHGGVLRLLTARLRCGARARAAISVPSTGNAV